MKKNILKLLVAAGFVISTSYCVLALQAESGYEINDMDDTEYTISDKLMDESPDTSNWEDTRDSEGEIIFSRELSKEEIQQNRATANLKKWEKKLRGEDSDASKSRFDKMEKLMEKASNCMKDKKSFLDESTATEKLKMTGGVSTKLEKWHQKLSSEAN